jgi:2-amino-4-hydroxy-6-hydroxymethyldihydropteridine diphosphokinase
MKHIAYLSLGSNIGDRLSALQEAIERIGKSVGTVVRQSTFYETEPWGFDSNNLFLNAAVCVETDLCPRCLLEATQRIELEMGRTEKFKVPSSVSSSSIPSSPSSRVYHDRIIDIDILLYDDITVDEPDLKIPHPLMNEREFVMQPLREIK